MSLIRKLISRTSIPIEQETVVIGDDRNSLITQESDSDDELDHDEMPPQKRQRNTDEQAIVTYGQEQGSSSNSTLSLLFNWAFSDPSLNEKKKTLVDKWSRLRARSDDVKLRLKDDEDQPGKRRSKEVEYWLNAVEEKYNEIRGEGSSSHSNLSSGRIQKFIEQVDDLYQMGHLFPNGLVLEDQKSTRLPLSFGTKPVGKNFQKNTAKILGWLQNEKHCIIGVYGMGGVGKTTLLKHIYDQLLKDASLDKRVYWATVSQSFSVHKLQQDIAKELGIKSFEESSEIKRAAILHDKLAAMDGNVLILDDMWEQISVRKVGIPVEVEGSRSKVILSTRSREVCQIMGCKNLVIKAEILSDEEAWDLFVDKLGFGHYNTLEEEAKEMARCIAKECGGLPLAIITMARSMRANNDIHDWKVALNEVKSLRNHCDMEKDVLQILKFSYVQIKDKDNNKDNRIQNCFLSCILFGEDVKITREELINMWINEGLFDEIESREYKEAKGHSILNKLESWCLLESCCTFLERRCVKMHDLVRDMANFITKIHPRFIAKAGKMLDRVPKEQQWSNDLVKVSLSHNWIKEIPSGMAPKTPNLTVLMLNDNKLLKGIPELFFQHMEALKLLNLSRTSIERIPESVSNLENLRALLLRECRGLTSVPESFFKHMKALQVLDLSESKIESLPESVSDLENLRELLLNRCENLRYVPTVAKLTKLRVLDLSSCYELEAEPRGLERLKSVALRGYCPWDISNMKDFSKFIQSSWSSITSFHFWIRDPALFTEICLTEKMAYVMQGRVLITGWKYREEESSWMLPKVVEELKIEKSDLKGRSLEDVLSSPDETTKVNKIKLEECSGMISITKVGGELDSFSHLGCLEIFWCGNMKVVFSFTEHPPHLPNLRRIRVMSCEEVEEIFQSNERASQCVSPTQSNPISLPNLVVLDLYYLPKLKVPITEQLHLPNLVTLTVICCEEVEEIFHSTYGDSQSKPIFLPNLKSLFLENLPKLKAITSNVNVDLPNLHLLDLQKLPKLKFPNTKQLHLPNLEELKLFDCEEVEEMFQIFDPGLGLPKLEELSLINLPKLKRVFPFTEQLHRLPNLKELRVLDCEEVEEIFQSNERDVTSNLNIDLPKLASLSLDNLPKLKWVLPITEQLHLSNLTTLRVTNCEKVEEILHSTDGDSQSNPIILSLPNLMELELIKLPKLKWVLPITEQLHLPNLKQLTVVNCAMLRGICRGLTLSLPTSNAFFSLESRLAKCPKLKVFQIEEGIIIVDSKSAIECILNTQFWENMQQDYPRQARLLSYFINERMDLWQGLDDHNDDDGGNEDGAEGDDRTTWGASLSLHPLECNYNQGMELLQGLDDNNDDGGGDSAEGDDDDDDDKTTWGDMLSLHPYQ